MKNPMNVVYYMRKRMGLTQERISNETGLTKNDVSRMENETSNAYIEKYITLARYFKIPLESLLCNNIAVAFPVFNEIPKTYRRMLKRIKIQRDKNDDVGCRGEDWVYKRELEKLNGTVYKNAVNPNYADDEEAHFDILSFSHDGNLINIEVKTTTADSESPFYFSADELDKARSCIDSQEQYEVHRVYFIDNPEKCGRRIISAKELFEEFDFIPDTYKVVRKDKKNERN